MLDHLQGVTDTYMDIGELMRHTHSADNSNRQGKFYVESFVKGLYI